MSRKKQKRFAELAGFPNVFDSAAASAIGGWSYRFYGNRRPLVLELGCGKGEYSLALASRYPENNVLGIDRKGERLWKGAKRALELKLVNVAFLKARIEDLGNCLQDGQVEEIWMPFPDPLPKKKQAKHRLLAEKFWDIYRKILVPGGRIHVKTDDQAFFEYVLARISAEGAQVESLISDLYSSESPFDLLRIQTTFEQRHLAAGRTIRYLSFRLP